MTRTIIDWRPFDMKKMPDSRVDVVVLITPCDDGFFSPRLSSDTWLGKKMAWHKEERIAFWCPTKELLLPNISKRTA